jgi:ABC-2 type transport system permease protein
MSTYLTLEIRRMLRSRRALVFTLLLPVGLFELIGPTITKAGGTIDGLSGITYYMISMATFGVMSATFFMGGRIAGERAIGWNRQLRLTALTGWQYVASKVVVGFALGLPSLAIVYLLGATHNVHMSGGRWVWSAVSILIAVLPIAAAGIWVGYLIDKAESAQQVLGLAYSAIGFLGGIYIPLQSFPRWLRDAVEVLPMAWISQAGRAAAAGGWVGWQGAAILAGWTVAITGLAARAYLRDTHRV